MASYVQGQLLPGEEIKYQTKVHWAVYLPTILLLGALIVGSSSAPPEYVGFGVILLVFMWIRAFLSRWTTELAITNKRVIAKFGFISRTTFEQQLVKIEGVNLKQSFWGRIMGYADIVVRGTGTGSTPIPGIDDPSEFQKQLAHAMSEIDAASRQQITKDSTPK
jgi:uncharacterized membrane protein YdbT with pleckstrin-like domain